MDELIEIVYEMKSGKDCPQCDGELHPHEHANGQDLTACDRCGAVYCNGKLISDSWQVSAPVPLRKRTLRTVELERKLRRKYDKADVYWSDYGFLRVRIIDETFANTPVLLRKIPVIPNIIPLALRDNAAYVLLTPSELHSEYGRDLNNSFINDT